MAQKDDAKNIKILTMIAPLASNHGLDWIGLDWIGLDWIGLDWIGLDWIGLDWIGLDWNGNWKTMYDPPHFQLKTGLSTAEVRQAVKDAGGDPLKVKYNV